MLGLLYWLSALGQYSITGPIHNVLINNIIVILPVLHVLVLTHFDNLVICLNDEQYRLKFDLSLHCFLMEVSQNIWGKYGTILSLVYCIKRKLQNPTISLSLRKHTYSNILKISPPKTRSFQTKILIFFIFLLKIIYVFWAEIRKIMYTPVLKGQNYIRRYFLMVTNLSNSPSG